jgi:hypothetical protein
MAKTLYSVVQEAGMDAERVVDGGSDLSFDAAFDLCKRLNTEQRQRYAVDRGSHDVMRQCADGSLSTEF